MNSITIKQPILYAILITPYVFIPEQVIVEGVIDPAPDHPYAKWAAQTGAGGPLEDQDNDGAKNLSEFAFGGDPNRWSGYRGQFCHMLANYQSGGKFGISVPFAQGGVEDVECYLEVGSFSGPWRRGTADDFQKTLDGLTLEPVTDETDLAKTINGLQKPPPNWPKGIQELFSVHPPNSDTGLIRAVVKVTF